MARLEFAKRFVSKDEEFWDDIIFSDEKKFLLHGTDAGVRLWMGDSEKMKEDCVTKTEKFSQSAMFWACFSSRGVGRVQQIENSMNSDGYIHVLKAGLLKTITEDYQVPVNSVLFMQDNASCHTAKKVADWMGKSHIKTIKWPSKSADLNPIENMWHLVQHKMSLREINTRDELISAFLDTWNSEISPDICRCYARSMPRRLQAVINCKGSFTKY